MANGEKPGVLALKYRQFSFLSICVVSSGFHSSSLNLYNLIVDSTILFSLIHDLSTSNLISGSAICSEVAQLLLPAQIFRFINTSSGASLSANDDLDFSISTFTATFPEFERGVKVIEFIKLSSESKL